MARIRIIKKNDEYSSEYEVGDIFEIQGSWYGGVHISGRTGVPISLDKEEYVELKYRTGSSAGNRCGSKKRYSSGRYRAAL